MKPKLLLLSLLSVLLTACNQDEPQISTSQQTTPTAKFSFSVNGLSVKFLNSSKNADTYSWDFGDGETSTGKEPTHVYSKAGAYKVTLTAKKGTKSNSTSLTVTLKEQATKANFTFKTEHPLKVVLTNTSTNATSFVWSFGDGTASTEKNPTHRYNGVGVYRVKLTARNGNKSDTYETNVKVEAPSTCYLTGFTVTKIPTNNKYYQIQLTDDYLMSKTTYLWTSWFLLSSANLPYDYTLNQSRKLNISNTYVLRLYKYSGNGTPANTQASGKGFWVTALTPSTLQTYPEMLYYGDETAAVKIYFQWK